ncbi:MULTISPECIES: acetyl-CoA carboxylase biotin carboxylase subunit [Aeribacillus]|uniref:acetyl-CoA carboxylase biotin carboxylase subunit n=1 Tax=Aeribacillus TaxID=1055323 RepID=UPI0007B476DD|nr:MULTISPECIES: acetyl-CoA carboxylase biotin carboxylase subunit [Aeribacillus]KZM57031.1 acetyl-CoA carboxylase biotin carboxylase subunit [Aeribacillus pallidus]MED0651032.1 acetyl-CoA carboxylase biotin carboxylase subunit [Aeribacillus composti]MED0704368.1 acetyl-CoA carboxylase biotin carboxylase subunit [Aeribacillus composti]MED4488619.1 acetyl-CoA carboxylase biotin carboxylase subunit [Aeribacillus pallidus]
MNIKKIFIVNRGEIAVRIIRSCKVLGIETVLAVSEADIDSLPARLADKTVCIGPANSTKSYLNIPVIITAAKSVGADAIHPGYGFLSEVAELAQNCQDHGLIFIGPKPEHISKMGNKLVARSIAQQCGVPVLPGSEKVASFEEVIQTIEKIGLPIMLKAAAGGGGRGMKIITDYANIKTVFESASAEAKAAFGDGTMYVEKYIPNARHIEVQILSDQHGNVIHLGERDCSTQRRHQKLIEEAPAPNISEKLRQEIREAAVKLAKNISYENAGTVEFIVDQDEQKFYFLEMNTRIQVEHPVTEAITGVDLVQEQINIARGEKLRFTQSDIRFTGHAVECRINAEAPEEGFRPSPGLISKWEMPQGPGVRIDTHCYQGYSVPLFYDSMIAKVIVHGYDRTHAMKRMLVALDEFTVEGIKTTIPFLKEVLQDEEFVSGNVNTRLLEKVMK